MIFTKKKKQKPSNLKFCQKLKIVKKPVFIFPYPHSDQHQKYNALNLSMEDKTNICNVYLHYKNILIAKKIIDECKFLNLTLLFFKKVQPIIFSENTE